MNINIGILINQIGDGMIDFLKQITETVHEKTKCDLCL